MAPPPTQAEQHTQQAQTLFQAGQLPEALIIYRALSEQSPDDANHWLMLGVIYSTLNQLEEAVRCGKKVVTLAPNAVAGHRNLGSFYLRSGQHSNAESAFRTALSLEPGNSINHNNLGIALAAQGKLEPAIECYRSALQSEPQFGEARHNLANAQQAEFGPEQANADFMLAVQHDPDNIQYLYSLAQNQAHLQRHQDALTTLQTLLLKQPDHADAYLAIADAYNNMGRIQHSITSVRRAAELKPDSTAILLLLGNLLVQHGSPEEAFISFDQALKMDPANVAAQYGRGRSLFQSGRFQEALDVYADVPETNNIGIDIIAARASVLERMGNLDDCLSVLTTEIERGNTGTYLLTAYARLGRKYGHTQHAIELLEANLQKISLDDEQLRVTHFHLGQSYDREKQYDDAFKHYHTANDLRGYSHDATADKAFTLDVIRCHPKMTYDRLPQGPEHTDITPIFIVGMPRSGTTLVEQIISSHNDVFAGDELIFIPEMLDLLDSGQCYPRYIDTLDQSQCDSLATRYLENLAQLAPGYAYVTDKLPANFTYLGLIHRLFPNAPIIHCRRNPVDTCLSCYFQDFSAHHSYAYDLVSLGTHYRQYHAITTHFREQLEIPMLDATYETMVADTETESRKLIQYCGLEWDDQCLKFYESSRRTKTASFDQVRQPIYTQSVQRWRHYEQHLGPLLSALGTLTDEKQS